MTPYNSTPGSSEWLQSFSASKAAAMLGLSSYMPRNKLLHDMHRGYADEPSPQLQAVFDNGHAVEALALPLAEIRIGESLYVQGGQLDCGLSRPLTATMDGMTINDDLAWEHKQWNESLAESVRNGVLPEEYMPQCQQILMVTGAEVLNFTVSNGTADKMENMDVLPDPAWFERIIAGWKQFEPDLLSYTPPEVTEKPAAEAIMQLPAVVINATGELSVCNLDKITPQFDVFISGANTVLVTDSDFVNADSTAKFSRATAKTLKMKAKEVVDQIATVSEAVRTLELYADKFDALGLQLEKLVKSEKEARKLAILTEVRTAYYAHVAALEVETAPIKLNIPAPDFAAAMKGLSKLDSVQNAINTALANAKIEADAAGKNIRGKQAWCMTVQGYTPMFFPDMERIIVKPLDDFKLVITTRIETHKAAEVAKLETERVRIQAEEEAKATAKAKAESDKIIDAAVAQKRAEIEAEAKARATVQDEPAKPTKPTSTMSPAVAADLARAKAAVAGRPTDKTIVDALALHFRVHEMKIIEWLMAGDWEAVSERMAIEFNETQA